MRRFCARRPGRLVLLPVALLLLASPGAPGQEAPSGFLRAEAVPDGYRLYESSVAVLNGEVLFRSELLREACLARCGAFPGEPSRDASPGEVRERMLSDRLVLQEQEKLGLGAVDNAAREAALSFAGERLADCPDPCAREVTPEELARSVESRLLVRDFLRKRVSGLVDVTDEEVERDIRRRVGRGEAAEGELSPEAVRKELTEEAVRREIRNWFERATSKARVVLSPLEEP